MAEKLEALVNRLEAVASRLESIKVGSSQGAASNKAAAEEVAEQVTAYDAYYNDSLKPYLDVFKKINKKELDIASDFLQKAFDETKKFVIAASKSKKPSDQDLVKAAAALQKIVNSADDHRAKNRGDLYEHLYAVAEAIKAFNWVLVPNTTISFVKETLPATEFYTNKVLVKFRKTEPIHGDWVAGLKKFITDLAAYVKEHHMTGLKFNGQGKDFNTEFAGVGSAPAKAAPAAPAPPTGAPPPPPPPVNLDIPAPAPAVQGAGMDNIFEQIRSGQVTTGLKKVTKDMKSKNQANRSSVVPANLEKKGPAVKVKGTEEKMGTPKVELQDEKKWLIQFQQGNQSIVLDKVEIKHTVYIFKCIDSVIQIKGKVNSIVLDQCTKTGLVFDNAVASVELVNCKSCQVQITGNVPTISVDKTDGAQLILAETCLNAVIVTSKSSEMNVCVPKDDEYDELPIPEQFETVWDFKAKKLVTKCTSHI